MGNVYTVRALALSLSANTSGFSTCPAGKTWIVTDADLVDNTPGSESGSALLQLNGINFVSHNFSVSAFDSFHWKGRVVVLQGEKLMAFNTSNGGQSFMVTAYELAAS